MRKFADGEGQSIFVLGATEAKRLVGVSLLDTRTSAAELVALAGLPVLAGAWALMSPPVVLLSAMTWDFLFNLSGAWHLYLGHAAHVDFHEPVGQLNFILTAIGFHLLGPGPFAFLVNVAIVVSVLYAASFLAAWRRLPLLPAAIFVVFVCLLALVPANVGDKPDQYTFAMSYNRYCWSAFSILALIVFVPPQQRGSDWVDMALGGLLLVAMFYLKITYFAAGLATVAFAVVVHPHVRRHWRGWVIVGALVVACAAAPSNHPYLADILDAAQGGAIRSSLLLHLNNFFANVGEHVPYVACLVVACGMWWSGQAPLRFPSTIGFLFAIALFLLSQNSQSAGLPSTIVIVLVFYEELRARFTHVRRDDTAALLLALLAFPVFSIGTSALTLAGYHAKAGNARGLYVVDHTNLRGLAVPAGERGAFASFSPGQIDHPLQVRMRAPRYKYSQYEYVGLLLEAADLLAGARGGDEQRPPGGIALLDTVNPLPFMLGLPPPRGANLWSGWGTPLRPAGEYLADVEYVLIPKVQPDPDWTAVLVRNYGQYLEKHFYRTATTPGWILLTRSRPRVPPPVDLAPVLGGIVPFIQEQAVTP